MWICVDKVNIMVRTIPRSLGLMPVLGGAEERDLRGSLETQWGLRGFENDGCITF